MASATPPEEPPKKGLDAPRLAALGRATAVAVHASGVVIALEREIVRVPLAGGSVETLVAEDQRPSIDILIVGDVLYYGARGDGGGVYELPLTGGAPKRVAPAAHEVVAFAADGTSLYWATYDWSEYASSLNYPATGTIESVPLAGGEATTLVSGRLWPRSLLTDGSHLYWCEGTSAPNALMRAEASGRRVAPLLEGMTHCADLAQDATSLFVSEGATLTMTEDSRVLRVAKDGGPPTTLVRGTNGRACLATFDAEVYAAGGCGNWSGLLYRVAPGEPVKLAESGEAFDALAVAADAIYVCEGGSDSRGALRKLPRAAAPAGH